MQEFLSDTVSIQQQPGLQMDERDEAAAPAEQVSLFLLKFDCYNLEMH